MGGQVELEGKNIVVTGGTGTIGRAIVARLLKDHNPERIVVLSRDASKQNAMCRELDSARLKFMMGDVQNVDAVAEAVLGAHIVIHAAACKHVPACEKFPREAIGVNITGSLNVLQQSYWAGTVDTCLAISTDKACEPASVMGMTKALMERLFVSYRWAMRTLCVRSGNVFGSHGSVIPLWQKQVEEGGPLTITDSRMVRYFISVESLVDDILQAIEFGNSGEIRVPKMVLVYMGDLAEAMVEGTGVGIEEIGMRLGEKLTETLISPAEFPRTHEMPCGYVISPDKAGGISGVGESFLTKPEIRAMLEEYERAGH